MNTLKCPGPIVKAADALGKLKRGQKIVVEATEDAFASDITVWCQRTGNWLVKLEELIDGIELGGVAAFLGLRRAVGYEPVYLSYGVSV